MGRRRFLRHDMMADMAANRLYFTMYSYAERSTVRLPRRRCVNPSLTFRSAFRTDAVRFYCIVADAATPGSQPVPASCWHCMLLTSALSGVAGCNDTCNMIAAKWPVVAIIVTQCCFEVQNALAANQHIPQHHSQCMPCFDSTHRRLIQAQSKHQAKHSYLPATTTGSTD